MQPMNPNAHTYVNGTDSDVKMQSRKTRLLNKFFQQSCNTFFPLLPYQCRLWSVEWSGVHSVECEDSGVLSGECTVVCRV